MRGKISVLKRTVCYLLLVLAFSVIPTFAQGADTSAANPPESAAILEALSVPVSKDLRQKITFSTEKIKVEGDWTFVSGQAKNAEGGAPNWKLTK
jgi:hypothetical protein